MAKPKKKKKPIYYPQAHLMYQLGYGSISQGLNTSNLADGGKIKNGPTIARLKGSYNPVAAANTLNSTSKEGIEMSKSFLNLDNHKIPFLIPEIRFYKIVGGEAIPIYLPVSNEYDLDSNGVYNFKDKVFSGGGVELTGFTVTLSGKNPYDVTRKFLNASLSLKLENVASVFTEREGFASIADLFTVRAPSGRPIAGAKAPIDGNALSRGRNCHIGVTFGYAVPDFHEEQVFTIEEGRAIIKQQAAFNLFYSGHNLNLSPDGSATIEVNYTGFMQSLTDFYSDLSSAAEDKADVSLKATFDKKSGSVSKNINPPKEKKKGEDGSEKEPKEKSYTDIQFFFQTIVGRLLAANKIHSIEFKDTEKYFEKSAAGGKPSSGPPPTAASKSPASNSPQAIQKNPEQLLESRLTNYFTFGDFLAEYFKVMVMHLKNAEGIINYKHKKTKEIKNEKAAIKAKQEIKRFREDFKKLTVLMADCEVVTNTAPNKTKTKKINISDIPISVDSLYTLVFDSLTTKGIGFYDMNQFLTGFCSDLLSKSLLTNSSGGGFIKETVLTTILVTGRKLRQKVFKGSIKADDIPERNGSFTFKNISTTSQYFLFCQQPTQKTGVVGKGNTAEDAYNGIFEIKPNKDKGMVKSVSFSKISQPAREAFLVVTAGDVYDELRIPHNATANLIGNNMFLPGSMVFVDPSELGFGHPSDSESAAQRLGIGGYYTVEVVKHSYSNGAIETALDLKFNHFPDGLGGAGLTKSQSQSIKKFQSLTGV